MHYVDRWHHAQMISNMKHFKINSHLNQGIKHQEKHISEKCVTDSKIVFDNKLEAEEKTITICYQGQMWWGNTKLIRNKINWMR